eukprot:TRINITY_DN20420_c0_g1_i1.p1 TRINITY_DN20420_c0_g1~~TRINITY_DN20420_c0_g1_i1.p1  ORF type:complete len:193 (-),score=24.66 TRINITY_DN20420_c0_g1_i1:30-608(-)
MQRTRMFSVICPAGLKHITKHSSGNQLMRITNLTNKSLKYRKLTQNISYHLYQHFPYHTGTAKERNEEKKRKDEEPSTQPTNEQFPYHWEFVAPGLEYERDILSRQKANNNGKGLELLDGFGAHTELDAVDTLKYDENPVSHMAASTLDTTFNDIVSPQEVTGNISSFLPPTMDTNINLPPSIDADFSCILF